MSNRRTAASCVMLLCSFLSSQSAFAQVMKMELPVAAPKVQLQGSVQDSHLAPSLQSLDKFGLQCMGEKGKTMPALVTSVSMDSPAYRGGLQAGDGIVAMHSKLDQFSLTIDRKGKLYTVTLRNTDLIGTAARTALQGSARSQQLTSSIWNTQLQTGAGTTDRHPFTADLIARDGHGGVEQHTTGNCWFEAALAAVADTPDGQNSIANMITSRGTDYIVNFPGGPHPVDITTDEMTQLPTHDPSAWASVAERAEIDLYPNNDPAQGALFNNPGIKVGLELLTGKRVSFVRPDSISAPTIIDTIKTQLDAHKPVVVATKGVGEHAPYPQLITPNHAYTVISIDQNGAVTLRNPHGIESQRTPVPHLTRDEATLNLEQFQTLIRFIAYPE